MLALPNRPLPLMVEVQLTPMLSCPKLNCRTQCRTLLFLRWRIWIMHRNGFAFHHITTFPCCEYCCGECVECKRRKRNDWIIRLTEHIKANQNCTYVTLTFSEESLKKLGLRIHKKITGYERENAIATLAVRHFTERWRKKYKKTLKHWLITELGTTRTERIHLHGIVESKDVKEIEEKWSYGYIKCGIIS